jgi:hypothetical protein
VKETRAAHGKRIVSTLSRQLTSECADGHFEGNAEAGLDIGAMCQYEPPRPLGEIDVEIRALEFEIAETPREVTG